MVLVIHRNHLGRSIHLVQSAGQLAVSGILWGSLCPTVALGHNQLLGFAASRMLLRLLLYAVLP